VRARQLGSNHLLPGCYQGGQLCHTRQRTVQVLQRACVVMVGGVCVVARGVVCVCVAARGVGDEGGASEPT
jgi:hypothetical protein